MTPKQFLFLIVIFFATTASTLAKTYQVVCNSSLNVREKASANARILGSLSNNTTIDIISIDGEWAEIQYYGCTAYISSEYIKPIPQASEESPSSTLSSSFSSSAIDYKNFSKLKTLGDTTIVLWVLIPAFILFYIFRRRIDEDGEWRDVRILSIVALVMSAMEFIYAMGTQNFIWFCTEPRWYWIAINFIVFAICVFQQLMAYSTFAGCVSNGNGHLSIYSWPVCLVVGIILHFCNVDPIYAVILLLIAQLTQVGIIFYTIAKYRSILSAFVYSIVYLIFTISTAMILMQFLVLLIIVLIGYVILMAIGHGSSSSSSSRADQSYSNNSSSQSSNSHEERYETPDGSDLHYDGFGDWHDDRGRHYHNTGAWGGRDMVRTDGDD